MKTARCMDAVFRTLHSSPAPHSALRTPHSRSGQSIIEFCIGLVGLLTVVAGVFQLGLLGMGRTRARVEAARMASERSMMSEGSVGVFLPDFVFQMTPGRDGVSYSADDVRMTLNPEGSFDRLVRPMVPEQMRGFSPQSEVSQMRNPSDMLIGMGMVPGVGRTRSIPVLPIVRRLFFNRNRVDIDVEVWSTRTGDIR